MDNQMDYIEELMVARLTGNLLPKDQAFLDEMIEADAAVAALWQQHLLLHSQLKDKQYNAEAAWMNVRAGIQLKKTRRVPMIAFGSTLVIAILGIVYYLMPVNHDAVISGPAPSLTAGNTIRFSSGAESVSIDKNKTGTIAMQAAEIVQENGMIIFRPKTNDNTISTLEVPQGLDRKLMLSDSTIVWVNAATKLSFPLQFSGAVRNVTLDGEAYFEVAKNKMKPFIVHTSSMDVEVRGTHFNIKSYAGEPVQTSLTEGSVAVNATGSTILLSPGQAAYWDNGKLAQRPFDESTVLAWMKGAYFFDNEELSTISHTVDRWFGYSFAYAGAGIESIRFSGALEKSQTLEQFLDRICSTSNLTYTIDSRLVTLQKTSPK